MELRSPGETVAIERSLETIAVVAAIEDSPTTLSLQQTRMVNVGTERVVPGGNIGSGYFNSGCERFY